MIHYCNRYAFIILLLIAVMKLIFFGCVVVPIINCFNLRPYVSVFIFGSVLIFEACVHSFLSVFYFFPNNSPSEIMKNIFFILSKKLFLFLKYIFKFLYFSATLSQLLWLEMTLFSKKASYKIQKHS